MKPPKKNFYMDDYVHVYEDVIDKESCDVIINKFKQTKDDKYEIVHKEDGEDRISFEQVTLNKIDPISINMLETIEHYLARYIVDAQLDKKDLPTEYGYEAVRIKRYYPNEYDRFDRHVDVIDYASARRFLAFFVYLNDVEEGGETEFCNLPKRGSYARFLIKPKAGRMIVFPPMFPWPHAGLIPISGQKFLLHSYLHYV
jgi:hypothetical protein